ncbi:MAG: hypothetical protein F6K16_39050 [Symploca sp. SIO2B6]|nr:hypothetical protein [Symploca sp. SIO2B6]
MLQIVEYCTHSSAHYYTVFKPTQSAPTWVTRSPQRSHIDPSQLIDWRSDCKDISLLLIDKLPT